MLHRALIATGLAILAACTQGDGDRAVPTTVEPAPEGEPVILGYTHTIASDVLGMDRRLTVRLPDGYDDPENADRAYRVVYLIDGGPEQDYQHVAGIAHLFDVNWWFEPFILVGVETVARRAEISPPVDDPADYADFGAVPGGSATFRKFLAAEVMPWTESRYRTGRNTLTGESLAGLFTTETFLREPDLFDDYIAVSPSLWWEKMEYGERAPEFLRQHGDKERTLAIYMADEGYWMEEGTLKVVAALETDAPAGLSWAFYDLGDEETHTSIFHRAVLDGLRALSPVPDKIWPPHPSMAGDAAVEVTPAMEALADRECTRENSRPVTPADTREPGDELFFACVLYDYGDTPDRGNWLTR